MTVTPGGAGARPRSGALDAVRLLGITAIVTGHAWGHEATAGALYAWHVPVFFILSGYLWSGRRDFGGEVAQRLRTLGRPYLFALVALTVALVVFCGVLREDPLPRIAGGLWGGALALQPYTTLWFVSVLFFTALLYKLMERWPLSLSIVAAVVGQAMGTFFGPVLASLPLGLGSALPCLAYLVVGRILRRYRQALPLPSVIGGSMIILGLFLTLSGVVPTVDIKVGDFGAPGASFAVSCAISAGLILVAEEAYRRLPGTVHTVTTRLALAGFTVVLLHPLFLWSPTPDLLDFALGLALPLGLGLLALTTRWSPWVTGQPQQSGAARIA